jgi:hypothetical protein
MQYPDPPHAEESNCRIGTETLPMETDATRAPSGLLAATKIISAGPVPWELPETVSQAGSPEIAQG